MAEATMASAVDEGQLDLEGTAAATPAQIFESYTAGDGQPRDAETLADTLAGTGRGGARRHGVYSRRADDAAGRQKAATPVAPTGPLQADTAIEAPSPAKTPKRNNLFRQITRIGSARTSPRNRRSPRSRRSPRRHPRRSVERIWRGRRASPSWRSRRRRQRRRASRHPGVFEAPGQLIGRRVAVVEAT